MTEIGPHLRVVLAQISAEGNSVSQRTPRVPNTSRPSYALVLAPLAWCCWSMVMGPQLQYW